jgi:hypothetical protein
MSIMQMCKRQIYQQSTPKAEGNIIGNFFNEIGRFLSFYLLLFFYYFFDRLLREMVQRGDKLFTKMGDVKGATTKYLGQYAEVNETNSEFEELMPTNEGDDLPEE